MSSPRHLPERALVNLRRHPGAAEIIQFVRRAEAVLRDEDLSTIRKVIDTRILTPEQPDRLFELLVGFTIVDSLIGMGYRELGVHLLPNSPVPFATLRGHGTQLSLWWQRSVWGTLSRSHRSRYREALRGARMRSQSLRPDFILLGESPPRLLLIEVKLTERDGHTADRRGIVEAMAYLHDAQDAFLRSPIHTPS